MRELLSCDVQEKNRLGKEKNPPPPCKPLATCFGSCETAEGRNFCQKAVTSFTSTRAPRMYRTHLEGVLDRRVLESSTPRLFRFPGGYVYSYYAGRKLLRIGNLCIICR